MKIVVRLLDGDKLSRDQFNKIRASLFLVFALGLVLGLIIGTLVWI